MFLERLNNLSDRVILLLLLAIALATSGMSLIINIVSEGILSNWWEGWLQNFSTEMFGAFLGFWLLGMIVDKRRQKEAKTEEQEALRARLIRELRSQDDAIAKHAIEELRAHGWLEDGSLKRAYFFEANLEGAKLSYANLEGAN